SGGVRTTRRGRHRPSPCWCRWGTPATTWSWPGSRTRGQLMARVPDELVLPCVACVRYETAFRPAEHLAPQAPAEPSFQCWQCGAVVPASQVARRNVVTGGCLDGRHPGRRGPSRLLRQDDADDAACVICVVGGFVTKPWWETVIALCK